MSLLDRLIVKPLAGAGELTVTVHNGDVGNSTVEGFTTTERMVSSTTENGALGLETIVALIVIFPALFCGVTVNVPLVNPCAMLIEAGTVATVGSLLESVTVAPPL